MTNKERQKALEKQQEKLFGKNSIFVCGYNNYCTFCEKSDDKYACIKAWDAMMEAGKQKIKEQRGVLF